MRQLSELSVAQVRRVTQTLDNPPDTWHALLGPAHAVLCGPVDDTFEMASLPTDTPETALRHAIIDIALLVPVLVAPRRLAQEHLSSQTFGRKRTSRRRARPPPCPALR